MSEVLYSEVKTYLGITVSDYDTQIEAFTDLWVSILNASIGAEYLADATLEAGILHGGKLLCIAGQAQKVLPPSLFAGSAKSVSWGAYKQDSSTGKESASAGTTLPLFDQGMDVLKPYMPAGIISDVAASSTGDYSSEFSLDRFDADGNLVEPGTIGPF